MHQPGVFFLASPPDPLKLSTHNNTGAPYYVGRTSLGVITMVDNNCFGVIGGDRRQIALAESIASDGYTVYAAGFDSIEFKNDVRKTDVKQLAARCPAVVLPIPVTTDGKKLNVVYSDKEIPLDDNFARLMRNKQVFGGMMGKLLQTSEVWDTIDTYDYNLREEFAVANSISTAEGALEIAMRESPCTLNGSRCLVVGFGRIGKTLAWMLRGLGAKVTASARKQKDLAWIDLYGYTPVKTEELNGTYDFIFNTVPAMIFNKRLLLKLSSSCILIDLSSAPGGVDYEAAEKFGIKAIHALSLPGKVAPKSAGEIIKNTIYNMLEE